MRRRGHGDILTCTQDHHHWRGSLPVNLHEREFLYVQMLYYPNGFGVGDGGIEVLRGSHHRLPETIDSVIGNDAPTPDEEGVWRHTSLARPYVSPEVEIEPTAVALGRGSMIFLNGRTYHGVSSQPPDSERSCRLFANCTHRHLSALSLSHQLHLFGQGWQLFWLLLWQGQQLV